MVRRPEIAFVRAADHEQVAETVRKPRGGRGRRSDDRSGPARDPPEWLVFVRSGLGGAGDRRCRDREPGSRVGSAVEVRLLTVK